jgi:hypothetical protein
MKYVHNSFGWAGENCGGSHEGVCPEAAASRKAPEPKPTPVPPPIEVVKPSTPSAPQNGKQERPSRGRKSVKKKEKKGR